MQDAFFAQVAQEAFDEVIDAWNDMVSDLESYGELDLADDEVNEQLEDAELYLFVYGNGEWLIDNPHYLQEPRNIVSSVSVAKYESADALAEALIQASR